MGYYTERLMIHKSGDVGTVVKVEKSPSGDTIITIRRKDGTTHRDYDTYFRYKESTAKGQ